MSPGAHQMEPPSPLQANGVFMEVSHANRGKSQ